MVGRFKKHQHPPLFLEDENFFQKSATLIVSRIVIEFQPTWPIFEKCSHLRENKRGGADLFPGFVWWVVHLWAESPIQI
jgi:hypothetical protein